MAKEVLDEVARAKPKKETRVNYTEKQIKDCTDECRHHGVAKGVRVYNSKNKTDVSEPSAHRWLQHFKQTKQYYLPQKRGGVNLLTKEQEEEVLKAFNLIRKRSEQADSELICSIARGIVRKSKLQATLSSEGGADCFSDYWGRCFLIRHGADDLERKDCQ